MVNPFCRNNMVFQDKLKRKYFTTVFDYVHDGWSNTQPQVSVHTGQMQQYFRILFFPFLRGEKTA